MSATSPSNAFPFLRLPTELRLKIYTHFLPTQVLISPPRPYYEKSCHPWALANVSRLIRDEFLSEVYSRARFVVDVRDRNRGKIRQAYEDWIADIHPALAARIKYLEIYVQVQVKREVRWRWDLAVTVRYTLTGGGDDVITLVVKDRDRRTSAVSHRRFVFRESVAMSIRPISFAVETMGLKLMEEGVLPGTDKIPVERVIVMLGKKHIRNLVRKLSRGILKYGRRERGKIDKSRLQLVFY